MTKMRKAAALLCSLLTLLSGAPSPVEAIPLAVKAPAWQPNPGKQAAFLACPVFEVMYGGAAGGGKSDALLMDATRQVAHPKYRAILFRNSYPDLEDLIQRAHDLYPSMGGKWQESKKRWVFPSGAQIRFRYIERDRDVRRYQGHAYAWIGWDELTHFTEYQYKYMFSRCRTAHEGLTCFVRASTNPGGPGHNWVKARFIDAAPPLTEIVDPKTKKARVFVPARLSDNPPLARTDYGNNLDALNDADRAALKDGDWDAYVGKVFRLTPGVHRWTWAQFNAHYQLPAENRALPRDWNRFRVMDWGYAKPFAIYWVAVDHDGRAIVYREWYGVAKDDKGDIIANEGVRLEPKRVAEKVKAIEAHYGETVVGFADPACWAKGQGDHGGGPSVAEVMAGVGVTWGKAKNDRISGKMALHQRLSFETGEGGAVREWPGLVFLEGHCPHAVRTIPALEYDEHRVEDVNTDGEDHAYDAIRYFCMARPWAPARVDTSKDYLFERAKAKASAWAMP